MKYYVIAGEASGDLHGSNLIREIKELDINAEFRCWGGDLMQQNGAVIVKHYRELAYMGFLEVLSHLPAIMANFRDCRKDLLSFRPDVLILIDYPGFNLRIASFARKHGLRVFYYISPQLWAWRASRVAIIKKNVERMFVILPFEKEFYSRYNYPVDFVGHPLLDAIDLQKREEAGQFRSRNALDSRPVIAILPGSRAMEIAKMLQTMLAVTPGFSNYQFVVAAAPSLDPVIFRDKLAGTGVSFVYNQTYSLLQHAVAAMVTSGTATLETALFGVPQVVCYKGNAFSYYIARWLVRIRYISLVNLIVDRPLVKELIQNELTPANLATELSRLLDESNRQKIGQGYSELRERLGGSGASRRAATLMIQYLERKSV